MHACVRHLLTAGGGTAAGVQRIAGSTVAVVGAAVDAKGSGLVGKQLERYPQPLEVESPFLRQFS